MSALSHGRGRVWGSSAGPTGGVSSTVGTSAMASPEPGRESAARRGATTVPAGIASSDSRAYRRCLSLFPNTRVEATAACRPVRGLASGAAVPHSFRSGATDMAALSHSRGRVWGSSAGATGGVSSTVGTSAMASPEPGRSSRPHRRGDALPAGRSSGEFRAYRRCLSLFPNHRVEATAACRPVRGLAAGAAVPHSCRSGAIDMAALSHSRRRVLGSSAVAIRDMNSPVGIATRISPEPDRSSDPRHRGSAVPAGRGWGESRVDRVASVSVRGAGFLEISESA